VSDKSGRTDSEFELHFRQSLLNFEVGPLHLRPNKNKRTKIALSKKNILRLRNSVVTV
jgi:hypothetical protein